MEDCSVDYSTWGEGHIPIISSSQVIKTGYSYRPDQLIGAFLLFLVLLTIDERGADLIEQFKQGWLIKFGNRPSRVVLKDAVVDQVANG